MSSPPPFAIRTLGLIDRRPWHATPGTRQGDAMLTLVIAGRGIYRQGGRDVLVEAGMVGLVPPQDPGLLAADPQEPYCHWYCRYGGEYALELTTRILAARGGLRFAAHDGVPALAALLLPHAPLHRATLPTQLGRAELALAAVLVALAGGDPAESPAFTAQGLQEHLQRNLDQPTDLSAIARHFGVSVRTLGRRCKEWTGLPVQALHQAMKMEWADTLLAGSTAPVAEVARRAGYADPAYFSRVYRQHHGRPPSAARR